MECNFAFSFPVLNTEVKPLCMSASIWIDPEEKIKLIGIDFDNAIEISWLEAAIEQNFIFQGKCGIHALKCPIENSRFIVVIIL